VPGSLVGDPAPFALFGEGSMERSVLVDLFVLFAAAKVLGELFDYLGLPEVVGELLGGVLVGPNVLGWAATGEAVVLEVVADLGIIILMFGVGLENRVSDLRSVGRTALTVGVVGVVLRAAVAAGLFLLIRRGPSAAAFVSAAVAATSIAVTARVLRDQRAVTSRPGRTILGAAVVDDIISLLVLAVVAAVARDRFSYLELVLTVTVVLAFVGAILLAGPRLVRWLSGLGHLPFVPRSPLVFTLLLTLGLAALSETIGLAAIVGAFLAGLIVEFGREEIREQVEPVEELLVPFFFAITGSRLDPGVFADLGVLGLTLGLAGAVMAVTVAAGRVGARRLGGRDALAVGVGMIPRGEVTLIAASLGLGLGILSQDVFGVLVAVVVLTSLIAPIALTPVLARRREVAEG
jgi:Kef-type K+ transport system membrane component KefB